MNCFGGISKMFKTVRRKACHSHVARRIRSVLKKVKKQFAYKKQQELRSINNIIKTAKPVEPSSSILSWSCKDCRHCLFGA